MKKAIGRPRSKEGRIALNLTLPPYTVAWLKATGNASEAVRALVDAEISQRQDDGKSMDEAWNGTKPVKRYRWDVL